MRRALALAAAVLVVLPATAAAEGGSLSILPFDRETVLTLTLGQGENVNFRWNASRSVEFNVRQVSTGNTVYSRTGQVGDGTFAAPAEGSYEFEFRNRNLGGVDVTWSISRASLLGLDPGLLILGLLLAVIVLLILVGVLQRRRQRR